jgi:hypothetical protein
MSDEAGRPDDELAQAIRDAILAGAAEGAEATARRIAAAASTGLDEVRTVLQALAAGAAPQAVTGRGSVSLSSMAVAGRGRVAAGLFGEGTLGVTRADVAAVGLSGCGTLGVGDVAAAADELSVIRQPDIEKLASQLPVGWTKQELALNSLFLVAVAYWYLPPEEQQYLQGMAILVAAVAAVAALLQKP